tara:strand:- start:6712 stop:7704 length:993 start_codon:yes stop_codon:yes gene_type:complete
MKIIVTGGAGFIGSHLVEKLVDEGHNIIVLDNLSTGNIENIHHLKNKIQLVKCDLSEKNNWIDYFSEIDIVFHLAALADIVPSIENPYAYFKSNVTATLNILEAATKYNIKKIIYSASSSCYGIPVEYPTSENAIINPQYPYALTKYLGEQLVMHWNKVYNLQSISLRLFNVYGTRSRTSGSYGAVFGVFLAQKIANKPLTVVGDGNQLRDFIYVSDTVDAFISAAKSNLSAEIINIGSGETNSVNEIVKFLNSKSINIPKRPGEPDRTWASITKAKKILNWKPKIKLEQGIVKMIENIDYWKNAPLWDEKSIEKATKSWFKYLGHQSEK